MFKKRCGHLFLDTPLALRCSSFLKKKFLSPHLTTWQKDRSQTARAWPTALSVHRQNPQPHLSDHILELPLRFSCWHTAVPPVLSDLPEMEGFQGQSVPVPFLQRNVFVRTKGKRQFQRKDPPQCLHNICPVDPHDRSF